MPALAVHMLATALIVLCLVPAGAHVFEMPAKMTLPPVEYMTVQKIYAGWAFFGIAYFLAPLAALWHAWLARKHRAALWLSMAAAAAMIAALAVFALFTYPVNAGSRNWTVMPEPFETARRQWEYSHAANAVLTFAAFATIVLSGTVRRAQR
jgi:hypothetical protein